MSPEDVHGLNVEFEADLNLPDRLRNVISDVKVALGRIAAAGVLMIGSLAAYSAAEFIDPAEALAAVISSSDLGYPDANVPCEHAPYNVSGACSNYDWGPKHTEAYDDPSEISSRGYAYRNCTDYVAWRVGQASAGKVLVPSNLGAGGSWYDNVPANERSTTPKAGEVAVEAGTPGHVAFVESVNDDGTITISEYNEDTKGTGDHRTGKPSDMGFSKFINFGLDLSKSGGVQSGVHNSNVVNVAANWAGDAAQDFLYITPRSDGGSDFAVFESTPTGIRWDGLWASAANIPFASAQFIPDDLNNDGLTDLLYVTPRSGGGFDVGYFRNTDGGFVYAGNVWSTNALNMNQIEFLPGHWTGKGSGDLAYVTPRAGGFDFAVMQSTGSGFSWKGNWWSPSLPYANTKFVPTDTNGDGLTDLLYVTPRSGGGFDMALDRNTGSGFVWAGQQWNPTSLDLNTTKFIPGYFASSTNEGFAYITPNGNGFDMAVMNMTDKGPEWKGSWWAAPNLPYNSTSFVPADNNNDDLTDMFYVTPRGSGGFDLALNHNTGYGLSYAGNQWSATNLTMGSTVFLPQF